MKLEKPKNEVLQQKSLNFLGKNSLDGRGVVDWGKGEGGQWQISAPL